MRSSAADGGAAGARHVEAGHHLESGGEDLLVNQSPSAFWSVPATDLLRQLGATPQGLASTEARERLTRFGANLLAPKRRTDELALLLGQFESPLILILLLAAGLSFFLHDAVDASIILAIVLASGLLGFWQERGAAHALEKLLAIVRTNAVYQPPTRVRIPLPIARLTTMTTRATARCLATSGSGATP
jgi:Mg2+-importing ATPase